MQSTPSHGASLQLRVRRPTTTMEFTPCYRAEEFVEETAKGGVKHIVVDVTRETEVAEGDIVPEKKNDSSINFTL